ncbi:MAG: CHAT domain-containing protein [Ignavibacteriales bacterium]|nr:CHAT domain-containing protein [Ignavibacteriales bacterium]
MSKAARASLLILFLASAAYLVFHSLPGESLESVRDDLEAWNLVRAENRLNNLLGRQPGDSSVQSLLARTLMLRGEFRKARGAYAGVFMSHSPAEHQQGVELAYVLLMLGEEDSALALVSRAFLQSEKDTFWLRMASSANVLGLIFFVRGAYETALTWQLRSLESARKARSEIYEAHALRQLGVLSWYKGTLDTALEYYRSALDLYRKNNHRHGEATTLSNIGLLENEKGDRFAGLRYQLEAFFLRKEIGDQCGLADSYYFLSSMPFSAGRGTVTYAYRLKSLELSTAIGYAWGREVASRALHEMRDPNLNPESFMRPASDSLISFSLEGKVHMLWRKVDHERSQERWDEAIETLKFLRALCASSGYDYSGRIAERYLSLTMAAAGKFVEAERVSRSLLRKLPPGHEEERLYARIALGNSLIGKGELREARRIFQSATNGLDSMYLGELRGGGAGFERAVITVKEYRKQAYELLVSTYHETSAEEIFRVIERERQLPFWIVENVQSIESREAIGRFVRLLSEYDAQPRHVGDLNDMKLVMGEIEHLMFADKQAGVAALQSLAPEEVPSAAELKKVLSPRELFIEYFVTERKILMVAAKVDTFVLFEAPLSAREALSLSEVLGATLLRGKKDPLDDAWKAPAQLLYQKLLRPVADHRLLQADDHVIIAPHRSLFDVPFHVLLKPRSDGEPSLLIQQHHISYVPSAAWLVKLRRRPPPPMRSLVAVAPSIQSLPFTRQEVEGASSSSWSDKRTLIASKATVQRVREDAGKFDVLHIASHAQNLPDHPLYSSIELYDRGLRLHELFNTKLPKRLVVLYRESQDFKEIRASFLLGGIPPRRRRQVTPKNTHSRPFLF